MSTRDLFPGSATTYDAIQQAVNDFDEVLLHARDLNGTPNLKFDIGANRILVTKPIKIRGVVDARYPNEKPVITGTSGWLILDDARDGKPGAGIFSIAGVDGPVEITNLRLEHTPDQNPKGPSMHGSSTIAYFADNKRRSALQVSDCQIATSATSGISIDAINSSNHSVKRHDVTVRGCTITGLDHPIPGLNLDGAGNYIGVKLGAMSPGRPAIDMGNSYFEVRQCIIDSAKWAGVAGAFFESNAQSEFVIADNIIGCHPNSSSETTRVGIIFLNAVVMNPALESWPKGRITLSSNNIKLQGYFTFPWPEWSTGILVNVNSDLPEHVKTVINCNTIDFSQVNAPNWPDTAMALMPDGLVLDGIIYQDDAASGSVRTSGSADIRDNAVVATGSAKPLRGIWLRKGAHDVRVDGNDLTNMTASYAQLFVDKEAHNCVISGNLYGGLAQMRGTDYSMEPVAVVLCDGDQNELKCTSFSGTGVPGWDLTTLTGGPGRVKLDSDSESDRVEVDPLTFNPTPQKTIQWLNASKMPNNNNRVQVRP